MWWLLFQGSVVFAVITANMHWQFTPNGLLAGVIGGVLAYGLTMGINGFREWRVGRAAAAARSQSKARSGMR